MIELLCALHITWVCRPFLQVIRPVIGIKRPVVGVRCSFIAPSWSLLTPVAKSIKGTTYKDHIQMLAAAELSTKAKIAVFFIFVAMRRYNAQEQRVTKIHEKQEEEEEEEKKACKYRKEIWFMPATGIVEWIVMVVTFPVVVVWRSRASEELIEPLHSHREKMKLLNSLPQNFQYLLKTSCPAKSVLTCLNCNYNDDDDDKIRTPYTLLQFSWNPSSASFKQRPWQKTDRVYSRTKNSFWRITTTSRRKVRK